MGSFGDFAGGAIGSDAGQSFIAGAAVSGINAAISSSGGDENFARNWQMQQNAQAFSAKQSATQYQRSVEDMRKAGLNPILAVAPGMKNSAASGTGGSTTMARDPKIGATALASMRLKQELGNMKAQKLQTMAATGAATEQKYKYAADTRLAMEDIKVRQQDFKVRQYEQVFQQWKIEQQKAMSSSAFHRSEIDRLDHAVRQREYDSRKGKGRRTVTEIGKMGKELNPFGPLLPTGKR